MNRAPTTAAVLVTHNSARYLGETLDSIARQVTPVDVLIAIDDYSTDQTPQLLQEAGFTTSISTSTSQDSSTRIAQNFVQGLRTAQRLGADIVILGDHDDVWHPHRVSHQMSLLQATPEAAMVASDGYLIDEHGVAVAGTLRDSFPVPVEFPDWPIRNQISYGVRHSLATGGASAVCIAALDDWSVPAGWLHDRWWSLLALRQGKLIIDSEVVIDYRISREQQVGLDRADQDNSRRWLTNKVTNLSRTARRSSDLLRLIQPR